MNAKQKKLYRVTTGAKSGSLNVGGKEDRGEGF